MDIISSIAYVSEVPAVAAVLITAALLVIAEDRRVLVFALAMQYVFVGLLYTHVVAPQIAGIKIISGLIVWLIVFLSAQQAGWRSASKQSIISALWTLQYRGRFRIFAVILMALIGWKIATSGALPFPVASDYVTFAAIQLGFQGLLMLGVTGNPFKTGLGILTFFSGFGLLYSGFEPALLVVGALAAVDITVSLVISYLVAVANMAASSVGQSARR